MVVVPEVDLNCMIINVGVGGGKTYPGPSNSVSCCLWFCLIDFSSFLCSAGEKALYEACVTLCHVVIFLTKRVSILFQ